MINIKAHEIGNLMVFDVDKQGVAAGKATFNFTPAGKMEAFFREVTRVNAMPPLDPAVWRAHGMELLGPPLKVE